MASNNSLQPPDEQSKQGGGHAWTVSPEAASEYLRARIPYSQCLIDYIFAYHEYSPKKKSARWDAVLDLGCGPGQLGIHMSAKFKNIYGRDVSDKMIAVAKILPQMDNDELQELGLFKPFADRTFDFAVGKEYDLGIPDNSVDMIVVGSAAHWFDWSSTESSLRIWKEWTRVLRPNGTLFATTGLPAPGSGIGVEGEKTKPLRFAIRNITNKGVLGKYYDPIMLEMGAATMHQALPMPWQVGLEQDQSWNENSKLFVIFDMQDSIAVIGYPPLKSDPLPDWLPEQITKYITTSNGIGLAYEQLDKRWKTTNPRRMAVWIRSASAYVHHLRDNPEEKLRIGRDEDLAARMVKEACQEGGLAYDETIELHYPSGVLALRRQ